MRLLLGIALASALIMPAAVSAQSIAPPVITSPQPPFAAIPGIQDDAAVLAQDAAAYAALVGIASADAAQRLQAQEATTAFTDTLRRLYADRLAGIAIEQRPVFRIVVLLTGDTLVADQVAMAGNLAVPVVFHSGAAATLDQLAAAQSNGQAAIRAALAHPPGMGIDQRTGELVIIVASGDVDAEGRDPLTARLAAIAGVPVRLRSIERPSMDQLDSGAAEGGARLVGSNPGDGHRYLCTAGFAVTDGTRSGIATAAHCPDELSYIDADHREHALPFLGQWGWGYQDVQINLSDEPLSPLIYADAAKAMSRPVTGQRSAAGMRAGDVVCHRGERTGYSCGTVELTSFAPAGDLCGGACTPSWITVSGPHCGGGDSGSPVFVGTTALGILKGGSYRADGSCGFYFYMSVDYLPAGWRLLTAPAGQEDRRPSSEGPSG